MFKIIVLYTMSIGFVFVLGHSFGQFILPTSPVRVEVLDYQ